jgi:Lon-like protease
MFSLEIMNQYLPEDLTAGHKIAGTGTIDLNENIGRIGGVFQKVISAERAGAEYFFLPPGNLDDAKKAARKIELVPVANLQEALDFLSGLEAAGSF